jgi:hypothetical protein
MKTSSRPKIGNVSRRKARTEEKVNSQWEVRTHVIFQQERFLGESPGRHFRPGSEVLILGKGKYF